MKFWTQYKEKKQLTTTGIKIIIASEGKLFTELSETEQQWELMKCCMHIGAQPLSKLELHYITQEVIAEFYPRLHAYELVFIFQFNSTSGKPIETFKQITGDLILKLASWYFANGNVQESRSKRDEVLREE